MKQITTKLSRLNETATTVLIIAILILINYILTLFPIRIDVTANKRFSLSPASKELVRNIDDLVSVKVFVSQQIPARYGPVVDQVKDLLWEYEGSSGGNLKVEYFDPSSDPTVAQRANSLGIYPVQFSDLSQEKLEVSQGYFGLAVLYTDKSEVISFIDDTSNLEYQISLAISNLSRLEKPSLGFVTGHDEKGLSSDMTLIGQALSKQYLVQTISLDDLATESELDVKEKLSVLLIVDPQSQFSQKDEYLVDQFLMKDKAVLFLVEGVKVSEGLLGEKSTHQLEEFFGSYGVVLNNDLVLDAVNEYASFSDGRSMFYVAYPFWPKITPDGFNQESLVTYQLESALFPWVSSLGLNAEILPAGVKTVELVKSSPRSWTQPDNYNLDPTQEFVVPQGATERTLAVLLEGNLLSKFKDKKLPEGVSSDSFVSESRAARMAVVGDAEFAQDRYIQGSPANYAFLANLIDYLAAETSLTTIRAKGQTFRPINELSQPVKLQIKYANIFGPSVLLVLFGFVYIYRREKETKIE
ncbi:GldG family protein [Patescibacteria group bacterium]|nr:GldG family protein [Patescibacteria group bacterium]MBU1868029.1 GldG family protein [Patescibacteria group bacterium]